MLKPRLLDGGPEAGERTIYVYRSDERKRPVGPFLLKSTEAVSVDKIRESFGAGWYYLIESGGGEPIITTPQFIPGEMNKAQPGASVGFGPLAVAGDGDNFYGEIAKYLRVKALSEATREPDNALLSKIVGPLISTLVAKRAGGGGNGELDAFLSGMEYAPATAEPAEPTDPLALVVSRLAGGTAGPAAPAGDTDTRRVIAALARQNRQLGEDVAKLAAAVSEIRAVVANATAVPVPVDEPPMFDQTIIDTLREFASMGLTDLRAALRQCVAANARARALVETGELATLDGYVRRACTEARRPDLANGWIADIRSVRGEISPGPDESGDESPTGADGD